MIDIVFSPQWFYGKDIIIDIFSAVVLFVIAAFGLKYYLIKKRNKRAGRKPAKNRRIFSRNAIVDGGWALLIPHGFHLFGDTVDKIIPPGAHGTKK